jgi:hypothetical protein
VERVARLVRALREDPVKTVRICLLLLLAVLLPVRGAVAAAMLCAPAGVGAPGEPRMGAQHPAHAMGHHAMGHHAMGLHPIGHHAIGHQGDGADAHAAHPAVLHGDGLSSVGDPDASGPQDRCTLCAAFCSLTPLVGSAPGLFVPQALPAASFPALSAPVPSFLSDGQERPPRSL